MADRNNQDGGIGSGTGGNTSGTGGPDLAGTREGTGAGAAGTGGRSAIGGGDRDDTGGLTTGGGNDPERATQEDFAAVDPELAEAIEGGAGGNASAPRVTGGKSSSEGTGGSEAAASDPGSPGGMGGAKARSRTVDNRPPGGVSPLSGSDEEG